MQLNYPDDACCRLHIQCEETVSHWDGDYHSGAYDRSKIFEKVASIVASPHFPDNSVIESLDGGYHLEDFDETAGSLKDYVATKLREINDNYDFVLSSLDPWDRKRGTLTMECQINTTVGSLRAAMSDEETAKEILSNWDVTVGEPGQWDEIHKAAG
jgi:hypothetical protein